MTAVSGYSEHVPRAPEETHEERVAVNAARDRQALGSLAKIAEHDPYCARGNDGAIVAWLEARGWVTSTIVPNPAGHITSAARDRIEVHVTAAGLAALEDAKGD